MKKFILCISLIFISSASNAFSYDFSYIPQVFLNAIIQPIVSIFSSNVTNTTISAANDVASGKNPLVGTRTHRSMDFVDYLLTEDGKKFKFSKHDDKIIILNVDSTYRLNGCTDRMQLINSAISRLPEEQRKTVQPVFLSINPNYDTPSSIANYTSRYNTDYINLQIDRFDLSKLYENAVFMIRSTDAQLQQYLVGRNCNNLPIYIIVDNYLAAYFELNDGSAAISDYIYQVNKRTAESSWW
jgi:cytochrome oxidase Cu insertion factor (SCO1/SenC/PrrC family)